MADDRHYTHTLMVPVTVHFYNPVTRKDAARQFNCLDLDRYFEPSYWSGLDTDNIHFHKVKEE